MNDNSRNQKALSCRLSNHCCSYQALAIRYPEVGTDHVCVTVQGLVEACRKYKAKVIFGARRAQVNNLACTAADRNGLRPPPLHETLHKSLHTACKFYPSFAQIHPSHRPLRIFIVNMASPSPSPAALAPLYYEDYPPHGYLGDVTKVRFRGKGQLQDPYDCEARRKHVRWYIYYMFRPMPEDLDKSYKKATEKACQGFRRAHWPEVPATSFSLVVDRKVWKLYCKITSPPTFFPHAC